MARDESHYDYSPSVPAAVIIIIAFAILLVAHLWRIITTRTWFCVPLIVGAIFEIIGYGARAYGHYEPAQLGPYIIQVLFILLAPILFAATVYMFLGRIIRATGCSSYSIIRTTWLTKIFVGGDILCFLIQSMGGGMIAGADNNKSKADLGKAIILTGLVLQVVIFGIFMAVGVVFHMRMKKHRGVKNGENEFNWAKYLNMLYIVSVFITVRNIFRIAEYVMGEDGYLLSHEWPIYVFDALLMVVVLAITFLWYLGKIAPNPKATEDYEMMVGHNDSRSSHVPNGHHAHTGY